MNDEDEATRQKSIHNERTKLAAAYLNGVAIAAVVVGGLAPIVANHFETMGGFDLGMFWVKLFLCLVTSLALHFGASRLLRNLQ